MSTPYQVTSDREMAATSGSFTGSHMVAYGSFSGSLPAIYTHWQALLAVWLYPYGVGAWSWYMVWLAAWLLEVPPGKIYFSGT